MGETPKAKGAKSAFPTNKRTRLCKASAAREFAATSMDLKLWFSFFFIATQTRQKPHVLWLRVIHTSTVGFPRESKISHATTSLIVDI